MVLRYYSEKYSFYGEKYPSHISQAIQDASLGRSIPSEGLTPHQMCDVLSRLGFSPVLYCRENNPFFDEILYTYVESGIPVLATSHKHRHAIVLCGHRCAKREPADSELDDFYRTNGYLSSCLFLSGYVANNDNDRPYVDVPCESGIGQNICRADIDYFIVPLYEKIFLAAEYARKATLLILENPAIGIGSSHVLASFVSVNENRLVLRLYLTSSRSFKKYRAERGMDATTDNLYRLMPLPKFVWVAEFTNLELFRENRILGEIVLDATAGNYESFPFIAIHYPERLYYNNRTLLRQTDISSNDLQYISLAGWQPYPMYVHNLGEEE